MPFEEVVKKIACTEEDANEIISYFASQDEEEYEYMDNRRVCLDYVEEQLLQYKTQQSEGCCGYMDEELTCKSGNIYMVGFNYGH